MSDAFPPPLARLVEALKRLPGVGAKSAQRMALHLLDRDREGARFLVESIGGALDDLTRCPTCRMYRAAEQHTDYRGRYFVLLGRLSPLEGTGPDELGLDQFAELLRSDWVREVILATNPTVEGETTAYYLSEMARAAGIPITRLAHGLPVGGELEYQDRGTLSHAFSGRRAFEE